MSWLEWATEQTATTRAADRWRAPRAFDATGPAGRLDDGTDVVAFASNDYLGLTQHPRVIAAAKDALDRWGAGAGAARLIVGSRPVHHELESALAAWKATEAAVIFPTGYMANVGLVSALAGPGVTVLSDELNHASIIDGTRLARGEVRVFGHADVDHVDKLLAYAPGRALVVTDLVFSMDGDVAPVAALAEVCAAHNALLVLDEAHSVLGPHDVPADAGAPTTLRVGTLSKTLGALGGFVAGPQVICDVLVNRARSYIFTTGSTPADTAAALAALAIVTGADGDRLRARLRANVDRLVPEHPSPIIPIVIGAESDALSVADQLRSSGVLVPAIRPPTVAEGTCRLRVALSAAHTDGQLDLLVDALDRAWPTWRADVTMPRRP